MSINYEERFRNLEEKIDKLFELRKDVRIIQKIYKFLKKNKKHLRTFIEIMLAISTFLGFFII